MSRSKMDLHELAPVSGRATSGRHGRRDEVGEPFELPCRRQGHPWPLPPYRHPAGKLVKLWADALQVLDQRGRQLWSG